MATMDERHWWISTKLQEAFQFGGSDAPTLLEDFMCDNETLRLIASFLSDKGDVRRLFFFCEERDADGRDEYSDKRRELRIAIEPPSPGSVCNQACLYFIRFGTGVDGNERSSLSVEDLPVQVLVGFVKFSALQQFSTVLEEVFAPVLQQQKASSAVAAAASTGSSDGTATVERTAVRAALDKASAVVRSECSHVTVAQSTVLRIPPAFDVPALVTADSRSARAIADALGHCERLCVEWCDVIDTAVNNDRQRRLMESGAGPLAEAEYWIRHSAVLSSLQQQLKQRLCMRIMGLLLAGRSKVLRRWKAVEASLHEHAREAQLRAAYMHQLKPSFLALKQALTPREMIDHALPRLIEEILKSKYSKPLLLQHYVGLVIQKVSKQVTRNCMSYLRLAAMNQDSQDVFWSATLDAIRCPDGDGDRNKYLQVSPVKEMDEVLALRRQYRDRLVKMCESLGVAARHRTLPAVPAAAATQSGVSGSGGGSPHDRPFRPSQAQPQAVKQAKVSMVTPSTVSTIVSRVSTSTAAYAGVSLAKLEIVMQPVSELAERLRKVRQVVETLREFTALEPALQGLPEVVVSATNSESAPCAVLLDDEEEEEGEDYSDSSQPENATEVETVPCVAVSEGRPDLNLSVSSDIFATISRSFSRNVCPVLGIPRCTSSPCTRISTVVSLVVEDIVRMFSASCPNVAAVLNLHPSSVDFNYDYLHTQFVAAIKLLEELLNVYMQMMFDWRMGKMESADVPAPFSEPATPGADSSATGAESPTADSRSSSAASTVVSVAHYSSQGTERPQSSFTAMQALEFLDRFKAVSKRQRIRDHLGFLAADAASLYERDLMRIRAHYEANKSKPPIGWHHPPMTGALMWVRQLLHNIERPWKALKAYPAVLKSYEFMSALSLRNRLASTLIMLEQMWIKEWESLPRHLASCLKSPILSSDRGDGAISVTTGQQIMEFLHEVHGAEHLQLTIHPDLVKLNRKRYQLFQNHSKLSALLSDYTRAVCVVPDEVQGLLNIHRRVIGQCLEAGISGKLAWNSTNIDTFLHCAKLVVDAVVDFSERIVDTLNSISKGILMVEQFSMLGKRHLPDNSSTTPERFEKSMLKVIRERFKALREVVWKAESEVRELLSMSDLDSQVAQESLMGLRVRPTSARSKRFVNEVARAGRQHSVEEEPQAGYFMSGAPPFKAKVLDQAIVDVITQHYGKLMREALITCVRAGLTNYLQLLQTSCSNVMSIKAELWFLFPGFVVTPSLEVIEHAVKKIAEKLCELPRNYSWFGRQISISPEVNGKELSAASGSSMFDFLQATRQGLEDAKSGFEPYTYLWMSDMMGQFADFQSSEPTPLQYRAKVAKFHALYKKLEALPVEHSLPSLFLDISPVKKALLTEASYYRSHYAQALHDKMNDDLQELNAGQSSVTKDMTEEIEDIDTLHRVLVACDRVASASLFLNEQVTPIEEAYRWMREMDVRVQRDEADKLSQARGTWKAIKEKADKVYHTLLYVNRESCIHIIENEQTDFEMLLAREANRYESSGPQVSFASAEDALDKLSDFQDTYKKFNARRITLNAVEEMFHLKKTAFPVLDRIGKELKILGNFFQVHRKFTKFINTFVEELWAECDIDKSYKKLDKIWKILRKTVPHKDANGWVVYREMLQSITTLRNVFPTLRLLASKDMHHRHWIQIMETTSCSISLEADVLKVANVLTIDLERYAKLIEDIFNRAKMEMQLERSILKISEEWSEQVLEFRQYRKRGPLLLSERHVKELLASAEKSQELLGTMLAAPEVSPLRDDAAAWAAKLLKLISILGKWLSAQDLWRNLEAVFSKPDVAKKLPREKERFEAIDANWVRMMKQSYDVKIVLVVCFSEESPKEAFLQQFMSDLEHSQRSLADYLHEKREAFPRFYFVNDRSLLHILSNASVDVVRPYLKMLFGNIVDLNSAPAVDAVATAGLVPGSAAAGALLNKVGRFGIHRTLQDFPTVVKKDSVVSVTSSDGDNLPLLWTVNLESPSDEWLPALQQSVYDTLYRSASAIVKEASTEPVEHYCLEWPFQVAVIGLHQQWTKDCHQAILDGRTDRQSLSAFRTKFQAHVTLIQGMLMSSSDRKGNQLDTLGWQKVQSMLAFALCLRDSVDDIVKKKVRNTTDFDWERYPRYYVEDPVAVNAAGGLPTVQFGILQHRIAYGGEYQGSSMQLGVTPLTDRCFIMLAQAMSTYQIGCLAGNYSAAKTETIKMLAQSCGAFLRVVACSSLLEAQSVLTTVSGCSQDGSWLCFQDVHLLQGIVLKALASHMKDLLESFRQNKTRCVLRTGQSFHINRHFAIFTTAKLDGDLPWTPPGYIRAQFRTVSMIKPDVAISMRLACMANGFKAFKAIGDKLLMLSTICRQQGHGSPNLDFGPVELLEVVHSAGECRHLAVDCINTFLSRRKHLNDELTQLVIQAATRDPGSKLVKRDKYGIDALFTAKVETQIVGEVLSHHYSCKLSPHDRGVFAYVHNGLFATEKERAVPSILELSRTHPYPQDVMLDMVKDTAEELKISAPLAWVEQAKVMYEQAYHFPALIVTGDIGSGKSTLINVMVKSLDTLCRHIARDHPIVFKLLETVLAVMFNTPRGRMKRFSPLDDEILRDVGDLAINEGHRLFRVHHGAASKPDMMIGHREPASRNWIDGVVTAHIRKAQKTNDMSWLWLDGPLSAPWMDIFTGLVQDEKTLLLPTCEQVVLPKTCKLIFECDDIRTASPSLIGRCGVVRISKKLLTWREQMNVWLHSRPSYESEPLLPIFERILDHLMKYISTIEQPNFVQSRTGLMSSCLSLLTGMLDDMGSSSGEVLESTHMEKLLLFSVLYSYGAVVPIQDRFAFSQHLRGCSDILPDFEGTPYTAFDFYVSDSGEWDHWSTWLDDAEDKHSDPLDHLLVETTETAQLRFLLGMAEAAKKDILLVGPPSAGKSAVINQYLTDIIPDAESEKADYLIRRLAFSSATTSDHLQSFLDSSMIHRQGLTFGPQHQKRMVIFIDDVNCAAHDQGTCQSAIELLRQVLETRTLLDCKRSGNQVHTLEDIRFIAAATLPYNGCRLEVSQKMMRQFLVIHAPGYSETSRNAIAEALVKAALYSDTEFVEKPIQEHIACATSRLLKQLLKALTPMPVPGRVHYNFSLFDVAQIVKGLSRLNNILQLDMELDAQEIPGIFYEMWRYEARSVLLSKVTRQAEETWVAAIIDGIMHDAFAEHYTSPKEHEMFVTLPLSHAQYEQSAENLTVQISQVKENSKQSIRHAIQEVISVDSQFEEFHDVLKGELCTFALEHVVQLHRCLVGEGTHVVSVCTASHKNSSLVRLAFLLSNHRVFDVVPEPTGAFFECLRTVFKLAVCENKLCGLVVEGEQFDNPVVLEAMNSLMTCGEVVGLFSEDELDGLIQSLHPMLSVEYPQFLTCPTQFVHNKIRENLRIVVCLLPDSRFLNCAERLCPSLLYKCQTLWLHNWSQKDLEEEARYTLFQQERIPRLSRGLELYLVKSLAACHLLMRSYSRQGLWRGPEPEKEAPRQADAAVQQESSSPPLLAKALARHRAQMHIPPPAEPGRMPRKTSQLVKSHTGNKTLNPALLEEIQESDDAALPLQMTNAAIVKEALEAENCEACTRRLPIAERVHACFLGSGDADIDDTPANTKLSLDFIGAGTFRHFVSVFKQLYLDKVAQSSISKDQMIAAIDTIQRTNNRIAEIQAEAATKTAELESVEANVQRSLAQLTESSSLLEALYARMNIDKHKGRYLAAVLGATDERVNNLEERHRVALSNRVMVDKAELVSGLERQQQELETRIVAATETTNKLSEDLANAKSKVLAVKAKIDRNTMERIRTLNSPPTLIGEVMEMIQETLRFYAPISASQEGTPASGSQVSTLGDTSSKAGPPQTPAAALKRRQTGGLQLQLQSKIDKDRWADIQLSIGDPQRFVDSLFAVPWEDTLEPAILNLLESRLKPQQVEVREPTHRRVGVRTTAAAATPRPKATGLKDGAPRATHMETMITVKKAKYASEDTAILTSYMLAIVDYQRALQPHIVACDQLGELKSELSGLLLQSKLQSQPSEEASRAATPAPPVHRGLVLSPDEVTRLKDEMAEAQRQYDEAVMKKFTLSLRLKEINEDVRNVSHLMTWLNQQEKRWKAVATRDTESSTAATNCLVLAAFLVYVSPLHPGCRHELMDKVWRLCLRHGMPEPSKKVLKTCSYSEFVLCSGCNAENYLDCFKRRQLQLMLPTDDASQLVAAMLSNGQLPSVPLLTDTHLSMQAWLMSFTDNMCCLKHQDIELHQMLEECILEGRTMVIMDVEPSSLLEDPIMMQVLQHEYPLKETKKAPFGNRELAWHESFRLVLCTCVAIKAIPQQLFDTVIVIDATGERGGVVNIFSRRYMAVAKHMQRSHVETINERIFTIQEKLEEIELNIVKIMSKCPKMFDVVNMALLRSNLHGLKKRHDKETKELEYLLDVESRAGSDCEELASSAAVLYEALCSTEVLCAQFTVKLPVILQILDSAVRDVDPPHRLSDIWSLFLSRAMSYACGMLEELDQIALSFFLAIEMWQEQERAADSRKALVTQLEKDFLLAPASTAMNVFCVVGAPPVINIQMPTAIVDRSTKEKGKLPMWKKPFDWLQEEQWQGIQLLACSMPWFIEPVEKMSRDGKEQQWRVLCETQFPQNLPLPDGLDSKISEFQRLLVLRTIRPDRILPAILDCTRKLLHPKFNHTPDFSQIPRFVNRRCPVLVLYDSEEQYPAILIKGLAKKNGRQVECCTLASTSQAMERYCIDICERSQRLGYWLILEDIQCWKSLSVKIATLAQDAMSVNPSFRLWFTATLDSVDDLPAAVLACSMPFRAKSPLTVSRSMQQNMAWLETALLGESTRPEWVPTLHNACALHSLLVLRSNIKLPSLGVAQHWNTSHIWEALRWITQEFRSADSVIAQVGAGENTRSVSWTALRYYITEVIYGGSVANATDLQTISTLVATWFSPSSVSRDFEIPKLGYKLPAAAFRANPSTTSLSRDVTSKPRVLPDAAETCYLHPIPEARPRYGLEVLQRINQLFTGFEDRAPNAHSRMASRREKLASSYESLKRVFKAPSRVYEVNEGPRRTRRVPLHIVDTRPAGGKTIEKDVILNVQPLFAALHEPAIADLSTIVATLLTRVPVIWTREVLKDRPGKPFYYERRETPAWRNFVHAELCWMNRVIKEVHCTLQGIKLALEQRKPSFDCLSPDMRSAYQCLQQSIVPPHWCELAGPASPPCNTSANAWMHDLQQRNAHLESVLTQPREKIPCYQLGLFSDPASMLSAVVQDIPKAIRERLAVTIEPRMLRAEVTSRDREHLRAPPPEGVFVHGAQLWGAAWERSSADAYDACPRTSPSPMPVIQLKPVTLDFSPSQKDAQGGQVTGPGGMVLQMGNPSKTSGGPLSAAFHCPVFHAQGSKNRPPLFTVDFYKHEDRLPLRCTHATLRPF
eukprot:scpid309/ scgid0180/ Dynein heavy chain 8, axonemal; Axonemal beta dynein heavy chain 8; Ciliary dynein heavy chain 8